MKKPKAMHFMVDMENVSNTGLRGAELLCSTDTVTIFYSNVAKQIEQRYVDLFYKTGCRFQAKKINIKGKNALDFYIASYIGELSGTGATDMLAIVSHDKDFRVVRQYWQSREEGGKAIYLGTSIEECLFKFNDGSERYVMLQQGKKQVDIAAAHAAYVENRRIFERLEEVLQGTCYAGKIPEIQQIIQKGSNSKIIYLDSLRNFGRKDGLEVYRLIKENGLLDLDMSKLG